MNRDIQFGRKDSHYEAAVDIEIVLCIFINGAD